MGHPRRSFCRLLLGWLRLLLVLLVLLLLPGLPLTEVAAQAGGMEPSVTSRGAAHVEHLLAAPLPQPDVGAEAVSAGWWHTCVLLRNGDVLCQGADAQGQSTVPTDLGPVRQISAGFNHTCAITSSGTVRCWGSNGYGQAEVPPDLGPVSQVSAGTEGTCVLLTDGTVRCWGVPVTYQPDVPPDLGPVSQVSANVTINGLGATCVVTNAGTVRCWGNIPELEEELIPADLSSVSQISTGGSHACTVNAQGQVRCWPSYSRSATLPDDLGAVQQISAGGQHTCAVTTDGNVHCWGNDSDGQSRVPPDLGPVSQVSAGFQHTCAVTTDGAVRCWGDNNHGQLVSGIEGGRPVGDSDSDVAVPTLPAPDTPSAIVPSGLVYSAGGRQYLVDLTNNLSVPFYPAPPRGSILGPGDTRLWIEMNESIDASWFSIVQAQRDDTDPNILLESSTFYQQFPGYVSLAFGYYSGNFWPELVLSADATHVFFTACLEGMGEAATCDFFELDLATRNVSMVAEFEGDVYPAWINPDGQRAIYTWDLACMGALHVRRERTALSGTPFSAVWLADKRFVYSRHICNGVWTPLEQHVEPQFDIILASANGSDERVLVPGMVASSMALDPDQQILAFITARPGVAPAGDVALWVVKLDGSGLRKVLDLPDDAVDLRWDAVLTGGQGERASTASTDTIGQIAFVSERDGNSEIYVMNADGSNQTRLTHNRAYDADPTWSPDGRRIAFVSNRDGNSEIYVMDADGSNQIRLTYTTGSDSPAWSPDGHRIAFRLEGDSSGIYVMDADGNNQTRLFSDWAFAPAWSPDGRRITFNGYGCGNPDHNSCVYVIDTDGNNKTSLATITARSAVIWSPDSSQLAYTISGAGASVWYTMHIISADGRGQSVEVGEGIPFAWTPDSAQIIGVCDWGPGYEICITDIERSEDTRLTYMLERQGSADNPSLSPDGKQIAFEVQSYYDGIPGIYVINRDGTGQTRLADGKNPVWRPAVTEQPSTTSTSTIPSRARGQPLPIPDTPSAIIPSGLVYSSGQRQYLVDLTNNLSVPFYPAPPRGSIRGPGDTRLWIEMSENIGSSWFKIVQAQRDDTDPNILLESSTFYQQFPGYVSPTFWRYGGIFLPELVLSADATHVFFIACLEGMGEAATCDFFELDLATHNVSMVAEVENEIYPAWINPDGQRAIYTWDLACMGALHVRRERTALSGTPFSAVWLADKRFVYSRHICNGVWTPLEQHVEPQFDIILASANGSDERVLVPGMVASSMALDPDQQILAFITARPGVAPAGDVALWVVKLDGSGLRKVLDLPDDAMDLRWEVPTEEQQRRLAAPPPLPTQGEIAYVQEGNIYLLDLDRWEATPLVTDGTVEATGTFQRTQLAWSPDGKRLAYASNRAGNYDIYVLDVESGAVEQITTDPRDESVPSFAPDGTLFFVRVIDPFIGGVQGKDGENHVIRVTDDGAEEVVTALPCILYSLSIDANGLLAVADGCNLAHGTVSVVDPNAPKEDFAHLVYYFDGVCSGLRMYRASDSKWSRDGATLAVIGADCFPGHSSGPQQAIFLVDPARPEVAPRRILSDQGWLRGLDWSPDDEWLVYANSPIFGGDSDEGIWIVNIEGGRSYHVVASGHNPAWRPIPPDRVSPLAPSAAPATSSAEPILPDNWWPLSPPLSYLALALGVVVLAAGGFVVGWAGVAWMRSSQGERTAHVGPTRRLSVVARTRRIRGNSGLRRWYWLAGLIGGAVVLVLVMFIIGWPFGAAADEELTEPTAVAAEPAAAAPETISAPPIATDPTSAPAAAGPVILPMPTAAPPPTPAMVEVPAPSLLSRSAWGARDARSGMLQHTPARIIVSHDTQACCTNVTPATRMRENQSRHMDSQGWPDIAYHYSIAPDGTILTGRAVELQGDSAYALVNPTYQVNGAIVLGILGNYDQQHPTAESLRAVTWLMSWLCQRHGIAPDEIAYLRQVAPVDPWRGETTSPGRNMPDVVELRDAVQAILVGEREP